MAYPSPANQPWLRPFLPPECFLAVLAFPLLLPRLWFKENTNTTWMTFHLVHPWALILPQLISTPSILGLEESLGAPNCPRRGAKLCPLACSSLLDWAGPSPASPLPTPTPAPGTLRHCQHLKPALRYL